MHFFEKLKKDQNKLIQLCILEMKTLLKEDIQNEIVYTFYK